MIGIYFGGKWFTTRFGNQIGNIELDLLLEEGHEWKVEPTLNPVERGAEVTDHIIPHADTLKIKGLITDSPHTAPAEGTQEARSQIAFDILRKLLTERQLVSVYTKYRNYDDMCLVSVNIPRAPGNGEGLELALEFTHIRKVDTQRVEIPPGIGASKSSKKGKSVGNKSDPTKDAGNKQTDKKSSASKKLADKARGFFK